MYHIEIELLDQTVLVIDLLVTWQSLIQILKNRFVESKWCLIEFENCFVESKYRLIESEYLFVESK